MSDLPSNISPEDLGSLFGEGGLGALGGAGGASETSGLTGSAAVAPTDTLSQVQESKDKTLPGYILLPTDSPGSLDPAAVVQQYDLMVDNVVGFITAQMAKSAEELSEAQKEDLKNRIRLGLENFFGSSVEHTTKGSMQTERSSAFTAFSLGSVASMMVLSASALGQIQTPAMSGVQQAELFGLHPGLIDMVPPALQSTVIAFAAFVTVGLFAPVMQSLAIDSSNGGDIYQDTFAAPYAALVAMSVEKGSIRQLAEQLFAGKANVPMEELINKAELSVLFGSLVALYKAETGWVNGSELLSLLEGGSVFEAIKNEDENDPRLAIVRLIQDRLKGLSGEEKEKFVKSHIDHYRDDKWTDDLIGQSGLLGLLGKNMDYEQLTENAV